VVRPDYYGSFRCVADKCKHNCCIGWEIDIDDNALHYYENQSGELGEKLRKSISYDTCAHFILGPDDRCPFLNGNNLCELILHGGEGMLCQICRDHPRFYNELFGVTEAGLGLSCSAAAKLILLNPNPVSLLSDQPIPQNEFFTARGKIFALLQNRSLPLSRRIDGILDMVGADGPLAAADWISVYKSLERLDEGWTKLLDSAEEISNKLPKEFDTTNEQLIHYFIYRHLSGAAEDFRFAERIQFAILSCYVINSLNRAKSIESLLDVARMYSSEIEYSDENVDTVLFELQNCNQ